MKKINKSTASASRLIAARRTALAGVRNAAFASGVGRTAVLAATLAACGRKPVMALYTAAKLELQIGFMGAALARKGDNREPAALMDHCRSRLTDYAGFGGKGKLRDGQKGRRTKPEEDAYASARVLVSSIFKEAGVTVPESRGGDTSKTRAPGGKTKQTAAKAAKPAADAKPTIQRIPTAAKLLEYLNIQAQAMHSTLNRSAKIVPLEASAAVADFKARIAAITL